MILIKAGIVMIILNCSERFNTSLTIKKEWIPFITFNTQYEISILEKYREVVDANEKLLELLHFTNSDIVSIDMTTWTYEVIRDGVSKKLPISRLSRGEKLLALCLMAEETKQLVYVSYELTQLAKPSIVKLMKDFKNSKYVVLVPPTPTIQYILESLNK